MDSQPAPSTDTADSLDGIAYFDAVRKAADESITTLIAKGYKPNAWVMSAEAWDRLSHSASILWYKRVDGKPIRTFLNLPVEIVSGASPDLFRLHGWLRPGYQPRIQITNSAV